MDANLLGIYGSAAKRARAAGDDALACELERRFIAEVARIRVIVLVHEAAGFPLPVVVIE